MSVVPPGSYRSLSWTPKYTTIQVQVLLPQVWGFGEPLDPDEVPLTRKRSVRCKQGVGKCTHSCELDQFDEGCTVDGTHKVCLHRHLGHSQCGKCVCMDPAKVRVTRIRESDAAVDRVDIERAWRYAPLDKKLKRALFLRHALGDSVTEIARHEGVSESTVRLRLSAGYGTLADYMNTNGGREND